jgi:diguanylate cyclase (GGDEF)-like protein/PAS domain S-box-containing protein
MTLFDESDLYRDIMESLPTGLCVVDQNKKIVLWSDGAERITGHLRHEVIGRSCVSEPLLHCDQPGCEFCNEECPLARAMKTAQPTEATGLVQHKSGHEIPLRMQAVPIHNRRGSVVGAVEVFEELQPATGHKDADGRSLPICVDAVTDVATRAMMHSHLRESFATFLEDQIPFVILLFRLEGLDHFRAALGTEAASSLLRVVARTLESVLWKTDYVGRWAEDEFLVILNGRSDEMVRSVCDRMRHMLANDAIEWWGERRSLPVSIAQATAQPADTAESLLDRAQKALDGASEWRTRRAAVGGNRSSGS